MKYGYISIVVIISLLFGIYGTAFLLSQGDLLENISEYKDSIHAAYSLGRLDLITALLAIITVVLALFGFIGYDRVRLKSEETAQKAVEKYLEENLERICTKWMFDNAPEIISRWLNQIENIEKIKESVADDISMHVDPNNE
ncbi:hypothetical protein [Nitrosomonas sp.]|uniref:hypothetical protein n=1 Tax=Nitrosomonas sp. TaxID=42353 RepID=UPI0025F3FE0C|nr:hypothetical protein [Nitrosomonas sp.]MBV6448929.1 hypothetical protein [Nitrosomonas sp.]